MRGEQISEIIRATNDKHKYDNKLQNLQSKQYGWFRTKHIFEEAAEKRKNNELGICIQRVILTM